MKAGRKSLLLLAAVLYAAAHPAFAGTITGRVLDSAGKPVNGARVAWRAYRADDEALLDESLGREVASDGEAAADEQGRFRIALEKPGQLVTLKITAPALPAALLSGPYDASETVELADIHLPSAARLTGRVTDDKGQPVSGARVLVVAGGAGASEEDASFAAEARTGPDGTFAAPNAPDGPRSIVVRSEGFVPFSRFSIEAHGDERVILQRGGVIEGSVSDPTGARVEGAIVTCMDVAARTDASGSYVLKGVPFGSQTVETLWKEDLAARHEGVRVLRDTPASVPLKLARAGAAGGTVVDEATRKPIAGARISLLNPGRLILGRNRAQRVVRTDGRGQFRAAGLGAHHYTLEASRAGYLTITMQNVAVSLASPATVAVALPRESTVSGFVKDEKGQAVAGARVRIDREPNMRAFLRGASAAAVFGQQAAVSGPDGAFVLKGLTAHRNASLEASKSGFAAARKPGMSWKTGEQVKNVVLALKAGLVARGKVVDGKNQPVPAAEVFAVRRDATQGGRGRVMVRGLGQNPMPDAVSKADGTFAVAGLDDGEYTVSVTREGFAPKTVGSLAVKGPGETSWPPIALSPGMAVAGQVKNAQGQPIPGAQVIAIGENFGRPRDTVTDGDGRFRITGLTAERALMLLVSADGFASAQRSVTPPSEDLALVLKSTGTVRGRVEDASTQNPLTDFTISRQAGGGGGFGGGFQVQIRNGQISNGTRSFQSTDGTFELTDVPPGKWTIQATASGYRPASVSAVDVGEGEVREGVVLSLKAGGKLAGRVLDPRTTTGVANASVTWRSQGTVAGGGGGNPMAALGGNSNNITSTDADGKFAFDGLPEGKVTITASATDYLDASQDVSPDQQSVDVTLGIGGSISGTVTSADGRTPVAGSRISLNEEGDTSGFASNSTNADGNGNYVFDHLRAGRYLLTATTASGNTPPREVVLADGQNQSGILLQAVTGALVHGTVTGLPAGQLGGIRVNASMPSFTGSALTDDNGNFSIANVPNSPAAVLRLTATTSLVAGRSTTQSVSLDDGVTDVPVTIEFQGQSSLAGRVTQGGLPMGGLMVSAVADGSGSTGRYTAQTDGNGSYSIQGMTDGDYQVMVAGQGLAYRKQLSVSGATAGDIVLPTVSVTGNIVDSNTGQPVVGATVQAETGAETQTVSMKRAVTDSNGNYTIDNVDAGTYQVTARMQGYQLQSQSLTVGTDAAQLNFQLNPGSGLPVRVLDGLTGFPLAAVQVLAFGAGGAVASSGAISLDATGTGEIPSLNAGNYSIYVFSDGYAPRSLPNVSVPAPLVTITMTPGGRVNVLTGSSFSGQLLDSTGALYLMGAFNLTGRLNVMAPGTTWGHIAPGSYTLQVQGAAGAAAFPFTVAEGQAVTVVVK